MHTHYTSNWCAQCPESLVCTRPFSQLSYAAGSPTRTFHHSLLLQLDAVTGSVKSVVLYQADVDVTKIEQAAALSQHGPSFVVS